MTQAALRIWCDGPPGAPLIIVAAGFLTETPARDAPDEWATPVIDLARRHGLSAASVQWTSKNANALFASCVDTKNMVLGALSAWTDARTEADHTAQSLAGWIRQLPHPRIHLVGHSLGARVALKASELVAPRQITSLTALAPACRASDCDFEKIKQGVGRPPTVYFSKGDAVLAHVFPNAERPQGAVLAAVDLLPTKWRFAAAAAQVLTSRMNEPALGLTGDVPEGIVSIDAESFFRRKVGHFTYLELVQDIVGREVHTP